MLNPGDVQVGQVVCYRGLAMKTLHLDPTAGDRAASVAEEVDRLLREGKQVAVTVAEERELLSPQQAAQRSASPASTSGA